MKKILLLLCFFFSLNMAYSMNGDTGVSLGVLGFGVNSSTGIPGGVLHGRLFTFMYQSELGVGINASPLVFNVGLVDDNKNASLTFVNTSVFFNVFRQYRDNLLLGPFVGINAAHARV